MIVVADTGPLNYLVLIEAVDVLRPLYTHVPRAPAPGRKQDEAVIAVRTLRQISTDLPTRPAPIAL